jgi:cell division protein FtsN
MVMILKKKYLCYLFFVLASCQGVNRINAKSGYRLVGKDGKVVYFEKKRSQFNEEYLKQQGEAKSKNSGKKLEKVNDSETIKKTKESLAKRDEIPVDSSAYTLKSVMDTIVKHEDIDAVAKTVESSSKSKSIKDFDEIPDSYFENVQNTNRLTVKQNENYLVAKGMAQQNKGTTKKAKTSVALLSNKKYYLQLGSFKDRTKAEKMLEKSKSFMISSQIMESQMRDSSTLYKIVLGPFNTGLEANDARKKAVEEGYTDAFTFKN